MLGPADELRFPRQSRLNRAHESPRDCALHGHYTASINISGADPPRALALGSVVVVDRSEPQQHADTQQLAAPERAESVQERAWAGEHA